MADTTTPDCGTVMRKAAALVTNRGGRTCHAAIVARELDIPAVVGCGDATTALTGGGFLLGHNLTRERLGRLARTLLSVSGGVVIGTPLVMFAVLAAVGVQPEIALLLAGISTATAPAATVDVVHEYEARGQRFPAAEQGVDRRTGVLAAIHGNEWTYVSRRPYRQATVS